VDDGVEAVDVLRSPGEPDDLVAAGGKEGDEGGADEPAGAGDADAHRGRAAVDAEVLGGGAVAPGEDALEAAAHRAAGDEASEAPQGQAAGDAVLEEGGVGAVGLHAVGVVPEGEGALALDVAEPPARLDLEVLGDPAAPADAEGHAGAGGEAAAALEKLDALPGRREALEGAGALMPGEGLLGRNRQAHAAAEDRVGHGAGAPSGCRDHDTSRPRGRMNNAVCARDKARVRGPA
jgi:hypothetical protein